MSKQVAGVPEAKPEPHLDVYKDHMKQSGRRRSKPTDAQVLEHLESMVRRFGQGVLEPFEVRLLAQLRGEKPPKPLGYAGGCVPTPLERRMRSPEAKRKGHVGGRPSKGRATGRSPQKAAA